MSRVKASTTVFGDVAFPPRGQLLAVGAGDNPHSTGPNENESSANTLPNSALERSKKMSASWKGLSCLSPEFEFQRIGTGLQGLIKIMSSELSTCANYTLRLNA